MINIAICDDESKDIDAVEKIVRREISVGQFDIAIHKFCSGTELLKKQEELDFTIVFLDIQMPDMTGFDVAETLFNHYGKRYTLNHFIIFVTAQHELVYESFDYHAFSFVRKNVKGIFESKITASVRKILNQLKHFKLISLELGNGKFKEIKISDIVYLESADHYVYYHLNDGKHEIVREKFDNTEILFSGYDFVRIHKKYIINLRYLENFNKSSDEIMFTDVSFTKPVLKVGRKFRVNFMEKIIKYRRNNF